MEKSEKHSPSEMTDCVICLEKYDTSVEVPLDPCGHEIHMDCIYQSGRERCPICRANLKLTEIQKKKMKEVVYDEQPGLSPELHDAPAPGRIFASFDILNVPNLNELFVGVNANTYHGNEGVIPLVIVRPFNYREIAWPGFDEMVVFAW